ncbi:Polyol transporter 5, partial [Mucuna pruriens]
MSEGKVVEVPNKPKRNKYAFACAMLASMTSILLGYGKLLSHVPKIVKLIIQENEKKKTRLLLTKEKQNIGVMSGAAMYIKRDLKVSDVQIEILVGILNLYSLIGSCLAGRTSDWIGRRYTIVMAGAIFFVGAILMGLSPNYAFLMFGRFVAGIGMGYALMISPVYTDEVSPASSRGFLTSFTDVFINIGILLGYISNYAFSKMILKLGWRMMLGISAIPSIFLTVGVLAMPESPRWLVMRGHLGEATKVLNKTSNTKEEAQLRLADIKQAVGIPKSCNDDVVQVTKRSTGEGVWKELFLHPTPTNFHILIATIGIHFFQQASGVDAIVLYSPTIFEKAGIKSDTDKLLATVAVGFVKTIFILVATFMLDRVGRRPLLLSSFGGMVLSLLTLAISLTVIDHSKRKLMWAIGLSITMVLSYVAMFSIGAGPVTWVYSSEIFPLRLRAQGMAAGVVVNRTTSGVLSMTFLSLSKKITIGGAFFLYAVITTIGWIFFYIVLPETRGKTLEEMEGSFGKFWVKSNTPKKIDHDNGQVPQVQT